MPVPVIDTKTSVLALTEGREYSIQFTATETPTSWAITDGELPSGLSLDTTTGLVTGTPDLDTAGSVYKIHLKATNGSGDSAEDLVVVIGVEYARFEQGAAVELDVSLRTGTVTMPNVEDYDEDTSAQIVHAKSGDIFPITARFVKDGLGNDLDIYNLTVTAKEFESESTSFTVSNGVWQKLSSGDASRYQVIIDLTATELEDVLSNGENSRDFDTAVDFSCEIEAEYWQDVGTGTPAANIRTSRNFILRVHRDIA